MSCLWLEVDNHGLKGLRQGSLSDCAQVVEHVASLAYYSLIIAKLLDLWPYPGENLGSELEDPQCKDSIIRQQAQYFEDFSGHILPFNLGEVFGPGLIC